MRKYKKFFTDRGDIVMPSVALNAARFAASFGVGVFGDTLFANVVIDPSKKDGKNTVVYYDSDDTSLEGGNVRMLNRAPSWYVDRMIVTSSAHSTMEARRLIRRHINFLCSIRMAPVFDDDDQIWYRFVHIAMLGRVRRPGRTAAGMDLHEAALRVLWRPVSKDDDDYQELITTGVSGLHS